MHKPQVSHDTPFARNMRGWMESASMTSHALAAEVGTTPQAVRHWRGGHAIPSNRMWRPLARALGIPVETLAVSLVPEEADGTVA